jgi:hypothetical protein
MVLETAQLLSAALHLNGVGAPYKLTHKNHPCTKWVAESKANFDWLVTYGERLGEIFVAERGKPHASTSIITECSRLSGSASFASTVATGFVFAGPEKYRGGCVVESYREYYRQEKVWL